MDIRLNKPVLVLEDQILIALYVEELLQQAGFQNIATYSSCTAAAEWLERNTPQIVVVETRLRDGPFEIIAKGLVERGIPFIVHSDERDAPEGRRHVDAKRKWFEKPCDPDDFVGAVRECVLA